MQRVRGAFKCKSGNAHRRPATPPERWKSTKSPARTTRCTGVLMPSYSNSTSQSCAWVTSNQSEPATVARRAPPAQRDRWIAPGAETTARAAPREGCLGAAGCSFPSGGRSLLPQPATVCEGALGSDRVSCSETNQQEKPAHLDSLLLLGTLAFVLQLARRGVPRGAGHGANVHAHFHPTRATTHCANCSHVRLLVSSAPPGACGEWRAALRGRRTFRPRDGVGEAQGLTTSRHRQPFLRPAGALRILQSSRSQERFNEAEIREIPPRDTRDRKSK